MDSLRKELETRAQDKGVEYFGIADLSLAREFAAAQGGEIVADFPVAIAIGMHLFDGIVEMVEPRAKAAISPYIQHIYKVVSPRLDEIALDLAIILRKQGYEALPVPHLMHGRNTSIFSYKLAAHLAGLGWIGKSCLLVTPEHGPRVRFSAVLTDAPLEAGGPLEERCGDCTACIDACPVKAFTGRAFRSTEPREARFEAGKCEIYRGSDLVAGAPQKSGSRNIYACGMCVKVCPYGDPKQKSI